VDKLGAIPQAPIFGIRDSLTPFLPTLLRECTKQGTGCGPIVERRNLWASWLPERDYMEGTDAVKLQLLQEERAWTSLDETRQCVLCEQTFTGHQVRVLWDHSGTPHLRCPTPGCPASPAQWIHPGNPLISEDAWRDWVRLLDTLCDEPIRSRPVFEIRKGQAARKKRLKFGAQKAGGVPEIAHSSAS